MQTHTSRICGSILKRETGKLVANIIAGAGLYSKEKSEHDVRLKAIRDEAKISSNAILGESEFGTLDYVLVIARVCHQSVTIYLGPGY